MVKPARKKQRLGQNIQPLGSVQHLDADADKDDEERRLESILFGTDYKPSAKGKGREDNTFIVVSDEDEDGDMSQDEGNALENLQDADLFLMDDVHPDTASNIDLYSGEKEEEGSVDEHSSQSGKENEEPHADEDAAGRRSSYSPEPLPQPSGSTKKKSAWIDPDDATLSVSLATTNRLRKLRDAPSEDIFGGAQYEARLRREFERINPAPEWARKARKKAREENERRGGSLGDVEMDTDEGLDELLTRTDGVLSNDRGTRLDKGMIGVERLRDANQSAKAEGEIKSLAFHPSPRVPVLMTASTDRRVRLFNIDGHTNPHLQTLHIPDLPVTHAEFHPSGTSILLTGPRPFFYTFDLQSGITTRSPRGLWGSNPSHFSQKPALAELGLERVAFNPSGTILAVAGRRGYIHLIDWRCNGSGSNSGGTSAQVIGSLKMNSGVQSLWWNRRPGVGLGGLGGADTGRPELLTLGTDAEVYVWDIAERRCVRRWKDDGGYGSTVMSGDNSGRYLSIGSKSGLVNIYGEDALLSSSSKPPKPHKTLQNLTTSISTLRFNHDSQLIALASSVKKDQMRLVHLPSLTAFSNWPTSSTPLGHVTAIDFSPTSEYIAIGNNRGRALLYQLSHFIKSY